MKIICFVIIFSLTIKNSLCSQYWNSFNMYIHEGAGKKIDTTFKTTHSIALPTGTNADTFGKCLRECTKNKDCSAGQFKLPDTCELVRLIPTINKIVNDTTGYLVFYRDYDRPCPDGSDWTDVIKKSNGGFRDSSGSSTSIDNESYRYYYNSDKKCIEPDIFKGLTALNSIDITITNNVDFRIPKGLFDGLTNLQTLKFQGSSGHGLSTISQTTFQGLIRLKSLVLDNNVIDFNTIHPRTFAGLRSLISFKAQVTSGENKNAYTADEIALIKKYCGCSVTVNQS